MNLIYLEYLPLLILLWNSPPFDMLNTPQKLYMASVTASTMVNAIYVDSMQAFMTESNVLENYNLVLISHIYKTIINGIASHVTVFAVYSHKYNSYAFILLISLMNHFIVSYLYYFGDLTYTHRYALLVKQMPHVVDVIIMIGCIDTADLQKCILIANAGMLISIYFKNQYAYKTFSMLETYSICNSIHE